MNFYYGVFERNYSDSTVVDVYFPDIPNAITFGKDIEEAIDNAIDVLACVLSDIDEMPKRSIYSDILIRKNDIIFPIQVDLNLIEQYKNGKGK